MYASHHRCQSIFDGRSNLIGAVSRVRNNLAMSDPIADRGTTCDGSTWLDYLCISGRCGRCWLRRYTPLLPRPRVLVCVMALQGSSSTSFLKCVAVRGDIRHTPIITTADCEGAGEMFRISAEKAVCHKCPISTASGRTEYEPRERRRLKARRQRTGRSSLVGQHILR